MGYGNPYYKNDPWGDFAKAFASSVTPLLQYKWQKDMEEDAWTKRKKMEMEWESEQNRLKREADAKDPLKVADLALKTQQLEESKLKSRMTQAEIEAFDKMSDEEKSMVLFNGKTYRSPKQRYEDKMWWSVTPGNEQPSSQMTLGGANNFDIAYNSGQSATPPVDEAVRSSAARNFLTKEVGVSPAAAEAKYPVGEAEQAAQARMDTDAINKEIAKKLALASAEDKANFDRDVARRVEAGEDEDKAKANVLAAYNAKTQDPLAAKLAEGRAVAEQKSDLDYEAMVKIYRRNLIPESEARKKVAALQMAEMEAKGGEPLLSDEDLDFWADVVIAKGGDLAQLGMGPQLRAPIMRRVAQRSVDKGITPPEMVAQGADYKANVAAYTTLKRNASMIKTFARTTDANLAIVEKYSEKTDRSGSPAWNRWYMAGMKKIAGDPDVAVLDAAMYTAATEYAKVVSTVTGGGVSTDTARKEAYEIINSALSKGQVKEVAKLLRAEMKNRILSYNQEFQNIQKNMAEPYWFKDMNKWTGDRALPEDTGVMSEEASLETGEEKPSYYQEWKRRNGLR